MRKPMNDYDMRICVWRIIQVVEESALMTPNGNLKE